MLCKASNSNRCFISFREIKEKYDFKPLNDGGGKDGDVFDFNHIADEKSNITNKGNMILEQYLKHNKKESGCYEKFVEGRKQEQREKIEKKTEEIKSKQLLIQSKVKVKKSLLQEILPKFFLAKIKEKKEMDHLIGHSEEQGQGDKPQFESIKTISKGSEKQISSHPSKREISFKLNKDDLSSKARNPFGSLFSGLGFSSAIMKKQVIFSGGGATLELKDRSGKSNKQIICAREGFCMVLSRHHFTNDAKDIWVLGGIGSDIITSIDHLSLSSNI